MSIYNIIKDISKVTKVYEEKKYNPTDVIAVFYVDNSKISLFYKDYSRELLKIHMTMTKYSKKRVLAEFWDPEFCHPDNICNDDIEKIKKLVTINDPSKTRSIITGFILTMIGVYKLIYNSYTDRDFKNTIKNINFDKNILSEMLVYVDIIIDFNENMIELIRSIYYEKDITKFLITPSGKFRLVMRDISTVLEDTKDLHRISSIIYENVDHRLLVDCYLQLLETSNVIYSPKVINSYDTDNILLNVLKIDIDLETNERNIIKFISAYINKGGSLDIDFRLSYTEKYGNVLPLLDTFKEYREF